MTVTHEVAGSIPVRVAFASVAQLVERMPEEHGVAGSTPAGGTIIIPLRLTVGHLLLTQAMGVRFSQRKPHNSVSSNGRTPVFEAVNGSSILPTEMINGRAAKLESCGSL